MSDAQSVFSPTVLITRVTKDHLIYKSGRNVCFLRNGHLVISITESSSTHPTDRRTMKRG